MYSSAGSKTTIANVYSLTANNKEDIQTGKHKHKHKKKERKKAEGTLKFRTPNFRRKKTEKKIISMEKRTHFPLSLHFDTFADRQGPPPPCDQSNQITHFSLETFSNNDRRCCRPVCVCVCVTNTIDTLQEKEEEKKRIKKRRDMT